MIQCKPYKAQFMTDKTCVKKQVKLMSLKGRHLKNYKQKYNGTNEILFCAELPEYYGINMCDGCRTGQRLFAKAKAEGRV